MARRGADVTVHIGADLGELNKKLNEVGREFRALGNRLTDIGATLTKSITLPLLGIGAAAGKASIDFESSFAGIRKTMDLTEDEFQRLARANRDLAKEIPVTADELNRIGELAGQMGIRGVENVLKFEDTIAKLAVTTNLTADEGALAFAQIANVMQLPQDQIDRLGSAVVGLGNNFATVESEIVNFTQRIAGAGNIAGLTVGDVTGIGTAFASLGVNAEAGGTAVQKVLISMVSAVAQGGDQLAAFAETAGMTSQQFAQAFADDAAGAFVAFVEGLGIQGNQAINTLQKLGLTDQRLARAFLAAAGAGDLLRKAVEMGNREFEANNALTEEAAQRFQTAESRLRILWNRMRDIAITMGDALVPVLMSVLDALQPVIDGIDGMATAFGNLSEPVQTFVIGIAAVVTAAPALLLAIGSLTKAVVALMAAKALGGLAAMLAPGGILLVGLTALAAVMLKVAGDTKEAREEAERFKRVQEDIAELDRDDLILAAANIERRNEGLKAMPQTEFVRNAIAENEKVLAEIVKKFNSLGRVTRQIGDNIADGLEEAGSKAEELLKKLDELTRFRPRDHSIRDPELSRTQAPRESNFDRLLRGREEILSRAEPGLSLDSVTPHGERPGTEFGGSSFGMEFMTGLKDQVLGLAKAFGPLAAAALVLKPVFDGFREAIGPAIEALAEPLREVGTVLGSIITPILEVLAEPLRLVADLITATLEPLRATVFVIKASLTPGLKVLGAVLRVVTTVFSYFVEGLGHVIRAIGKAIDALPGVRAPGIIRRGQEMIDDARAMRRNTDARDEETEAIKSVTDALSNVPRVLPLALMRFRAATSGGLSPGSGSSGGSGGGPNRRDPVPSVPTDPGGGRERPVIDVRVLLDGRDVTRSVETQVANKEWRGGTTRLAPAV